MNPKCTLPEEMRAEALAQFDGWGLSEEEERRIRALFPQYLFFRNEYPDDGWTVSDPVRLCTCTVCGESFEAVRGNYTRGKLHHEKCNCPQCGAQVEGIAAGKYTYDMPSLTSWVKVAIARAGDGGELLVLAGNARRTFNYDCLTGDLDFFPVKKYYFSMQHGTCEWKEQLEWEGCHVSGRRWMPTKTVGDPFQPNFMGWADYDGTYSIIGIGDALPYTDLKYCQIIDFFERRAYVDIDHDKPARAIMSYLGWYTVHPQIEFAVKIGLEGAVEQLITEGRKNADLLNWRAKSPEKFLRMSKADVRRFRKNEMSFDDLRAMKQEKDLSIQEYLEICEKIGGRDYIKELMACAKAAGVSGREAARYVAGLQPDCPRYAVPPRTIIRTWKDYLDMAAELEYDLSVKTVAMPKNLSERHDAAAETIYVKTHEDELKQYRKRRRKLEQQYRYSAGGYGIFIPTSAEEIANEGKTLCHCVGGYAARHMKGTTTILFLRRTRTPGRSFLTLEMETKAGKIVIKQIHGYRNERYGAAQKPEERFAWFLEPWLEWVNAGSERDHDGKPVLPGAEQIETEVRTA